jgi:hypothetical protein
MGKPPKHRPLPVLPETIEVLNEMDSGDDRTCAIVGHAYLENNLVLAIMSRLRDMNAQEQKTLFDEPLSVLGRFAAKIEIARALNLFGDCGIGLQALLVLPHHPQTQIEQGALCSPHRRKT